MSPRTFSFFAPVTPVSVNRGTIGRTKVKSPEMRTYQEAVTAYGLNAMRTANQGTMTGPVEVEIVFFFATDLADDDNPVKPTRDVLQIPDGRRNRPGCSLIENDRQIRATTSRKVVGEGVGVQVTVREVYPAAAENTHRALTLPTARQRTRNATKRLVSSRKDYR